MFYKLYRTEENTPTIDSDIDVAYCDSPVKPPCRMSIDELKTELRQSIEDARNGLYITIEQARARHPRL